MTGSYSTSFLDEAADSLLALEVVVIEVARTALGGIALDPKALSQLAREAAESAGGVRVGRTLDVSLADDGA